MVSKLDEDLEIEDLLELQKDSLFENVRFTPLTVHNVYGPISLEERNMRLCEIWVKEMKEAL